MNPLKCLVMSVKSLLRGELLLSGEILLGPFVGGFRLIGMETFIGEVIGIGIVIFIGMVIFMGDKIGAMGSVGDMIGNEEIGEEGGRGDDSIGTGSIMAVPATAKKFAIKGNLLSVTG